MVFGTDGYIYAIGGLIGNISTNQVERYNTATDTWQNVASMNNARSDLAAAVGPDGRIYAIGGYNSPGGTSNLAVVEAFNPPSTAFPQGQWVAAPAMTAQRAGHHAVTGLDGNIYVYAGTSGNTWEVFNGNQWTAKGNLSFNTGGFNAVTGPDGLMYQLGHDGGVFHGSSQVTAYTGAGQSADVVPDLVQSRSVRGAATAAEGQIIVTGGYRKSFGTMNYVEFYGPLKAPLSPDARAWWRFNEANGPTVIDSKGANTGSVVGNAVHAASGRVSRSLIFNGSSQYVKVNNSASLNFGTGSFTIEGWIKWNPPGGTGIVPVLDKRTFSTGKYKGYHLYITSTGKLGVQLANGTTYQNYTAVQTTIPANKWTHIAVTINRTAAPNAIKLYVNSVQDIIFTPLAGSITNTAPLNIGKHLFNNTYFKGELDELTLYGAALKWAEIRGIFLAGKEGKQ